MKKTRKVLSVFLATLVLMSTLVCGFSAFAAEDKYAQFITALKDGSDVLDSNREYYVKDLNNYTVVNEPDDWSNEGSTVAYRHSVLAKDNYGRLIETAAKKFYGIVDDIKSYKYGTGAYNTQEIAETIKTKVYPEMSGTSHLVHTNSDGTKLYIAPTSVLVDQGTDDIITIDQYNNLVLQATVFPTNVSNSKVFWRVISGSNYVDVDQTGRVYAFRPTPADEPAILECIAVDSISVTTPAVYDAAGNVVSAPRFNMDNAKSALFYVAVRDIVFNDPDTGVQTADSSAEERALANYNIESLPNYGRTAKDIQADLAAVTPNHLSDEDAVTLAGLLRKESLTDAEFDQVASFCYSQIQETVLKDYNVNIANYDLANLSASGLDSVQISAIKQAIRNEATNFINSCNWTDEYSFFNVEALVNYYLGNAGVVNNANWFHTFDFAVETDVETVMIDLFRQRGGFESATTTYPAFNVVSLRYEWKHVREYDESGTKPRYVLDKEYYKKTETSTREADAFNELAALNSAAEALYSYVTSSSGINPATIDAAMEIRKRGGKIIAVASSYWQKEMPADHFIRHSSGKNLFDFAEVCIDDYNPVGDAIVNLPGLDTPIAPVSNVVDFTIAHLLEIECCRICLERGIVPPVWNSANTPGGDQKNAAYLKKYKPLIKSL